MLEMLRYHLEEERESIFQCFQSAGVISDIHSGERSAVVHLAYLCALLVPCLRIPIK